MHTYWKDPEEMWGNDNIAEGKVTARAHSLCGREKQASRARWPLTRAGMVHPWCRSEFRDR